MMKIQSSWAGREDQCIVSYSAGKIIYQFIYKGLVNKYRIWGFLYWMWQDASCICMILYSKWSHHMAHGITGFPQSCLQRKDKLWGNYTLGLTHLLRVGWTIWWIWLKDVFYFFVHLLNKCEFCYIFFFHFLFRVAWWHFVFLDFFLLKCLYF